MNKMIFSVIFAAASSLLLADAYNPYSNQGNDQNTRSNQGYVNPRDQNYSTFRNSDQNDVNGQGFQNGQNAPNMRFQNNQQSNTPSRGFDNQQGYRQNPYLSDSYNQSANTSDTLQQGQTVADKDIRDRLKSKLGGGWFSKGYENVTYLVQNGNVLLRGTVDKPEEKNKVEEIAKGIDGVRSVTNQIVIENKKGTSSYY